MLSRFKKHLMAAAAVLALASVPMALPAQAANVPLISGAVDPANEIGTINGVIQSFNFGATGNQAVLPAATTTSGTSINTLFTYTMPGGQLASVGNILHVHAWGVNSADANVKTVTFAFGATTCAQIVTGSGNTWDTDFYVVKSGASTQITMCKGLTGTTLVAPVEATGAVTDTAAVTVTVSGTAATAGTMTLAGAYVEQLK